MNDGPSTSVRGSLAVGTAVALNIGLLLGFETMGIDLRVPVRAGATEFTRMTLPPVLIITFASTAMAVLLAMTLDRVTRKARIIFSSVVVLFAFLSLLTLLPLDSPSTDRVFQGVMHLVPAAALVALVSPTLRSE